MTNSTKKEFDENIKVGIEYLASLILENSGVYREYADDQLSDACLIFQEVFMAKMYEHHKEKLTQEQMEVLAEEAGKSLHQTVLLFTGVDLHKIYTKSV